MSWDNCLDVVMGKVISLKPDLKGQGSVNLKLAIIYGKELS